MEEIINSWDSELEDYAIIFRKQALEVAKWDRVLLENNDKVIEKNYHPLIYLFIFSRLWPYMVVYRRYPWHRNNWTPTWR